MKKVILMMAFAIATVTVVSCDKKAKTETTTEHEGHDHKAGEAHQMAYVCPMDCEKGKTYEAEGKCPVCDMALVEKKHTESDGHDHSKTKELTPEEKEHGHSHGEEGHDH
ncbi:heavy metal-binding domain-containing protein [Flavobacterium buctense]|uniref:heavy metal-binding domain-containing protein n=1 Tax=Flavobacterium buctense TaxID=1648146 RepID=UPI00360B151F